MPKMFLDPDKPLHTCSAKSCLNCELSSKIYCHFNIKQLLGFLLMAFPAFIIAGVVIFQYHPLFLIIWVILMLSFFGFIEIRALCSHCPHYAEPDIKTLKCWANYGSPKLWKYRPGPMSLSEKMVFYAGLLVIYGYPIIFFILDSSYLWGVVYLLLILANTWLLKKYYCSRCMNFACPLNHVSKEIRNNFFQKNLIIRDGWRE
jgi:hypothetical protein